MKPLNSGHLRVLKNFSVIEWGPLLGGNLKNIFQHFVSYSWPLFGCRLLGGFTVVNYVASFIAD